MAGDSQALSTGLTNSPPPTVSQPSAKSGLKSRLVNLASSITLEGARKAVVNVAVIAAVVLGGMVVWKATVKEVYLIGPISVPKSLEVQGYTSELIAQRILDEIADINQKTVGFLDDRGPFSTSRDAAPTISVSVAGSPVSLDTIVLVLRQFFGVTDTRISGEILVEESTLKIAEISALAVGRPVAIPAVPAAALSSPRYSLRLRVTDHGVIDREPEVSEKLDLVFKSAALQVVGRFEPYRAGVYYSRSDDFDNALRMANICLVKRTLCDPLLGLNLRATVAMRQGRYEYAVSELEQLVNEHPDFALPWANLARSYLAQARKIKSDNRAKRDLLNRANNAAQKAISIDKNSRTLAFAYETAGLIAKEQGDTDAAKEYFSKSVFAYPEYVSAYRNQESVIRDKDKPDISIDLFRLAAAADPNDANTYTAWASFVRRIPGRRDEALAQVARAIRADPKNPAGYNLLGLLALDGEEWEKSADMFRQAIQKRSDEIIYYRNLGLALTGGGKEDDAIAMLSKALSIDANDVWTYAYWGQALAHKSGRDEKLSLEAVKMLEHAREMASENGFVLSEIGKGYELLGRYKDAIIAYEKAVLSVDWETEKLLNEKITRLRAKPDEAASR